MQQRVVKSGEVSEGVKQQNRVRICEMQARLQNNSNKKKRLSITEQPL
jgi:hypothetical protein